MSGARDVSPNAKIEQSVEVSPNDADLRVVAEGCYTIPAILEKVY